MAANNKQYLIPGYGYIDEKNEDEQWLIPGYGFTDEGVVVAAATVDLTLPQLSLSAFSSPGIVDITLPQFAVDATALSHGVASISLPVLTLSATGTPGINEASLTLPQFNVQGGSGATGEITLPIFTVNSTSLIHGVADLNLPVLTVSSTGSAGLTEASLTLPIFATDFAGHLQVDGTVTLPLLSLSAADVPPATATITFPSLSVQGLSGATANLDLPVLTVESFAAALADITLPQVVVAGTATTGLDVSGDTSITLPLFTLLARGFKGSPPDCVVLNTKNSAVSEYLNYGFNSMTRFNGVNLIADQNGIYEQDTTALDDDTYKIKAHIKSGETDIFNGHVQRLRNAWINYESDGDLQVVTRADGSITRRYSLPVQNTDGINERRIKFERGIRDRVFDFKIENVNGASMEIESLDVMLEPIIGKKG